MSRPALHAVVLAGGAGVRFWPLSREARPKPLLPLLGERTLLEAALARARAVADEGCVWLVCGRRHARAMKRVAALPARRVLVEPCMRNTAPAIALAAQRITREDPDALMAVLPADHRIEGEGAFRRVLRRGARVARAGCLVVFGVTPTRPETGYGYIRLGREMQRASGSPGVYEVARFVEKPDAARARRYLSRGGFLWNSGIFAWRAELLLEEIARHAPRIHRALAPLAGLSARALSGRLADAYRRLPACSIDTAVLEKSNRLCCLPVDFRWSDIGNWRALAEAAGVNAQRSRVLAGEAQLLQAPGNLVMAGARPVFLLGVSNLVVVDAEDALLVAGLEGRDDDALRELARRLARSGRDDLL